MDCHDKDRHQSLHFNMIDVAFAPRMLQYISPFRPSVKTDLGKRLFLLDARVLRFRDR